MVLLIIAVAVALFISNRFPAVIVGVGMVIAFFLTGGLELRQAVGGFGDPVVVMLFGLFVVAAGLESAGVTTWAGQKFVEAAGGSEIKVFLFLFLTASIMTAVIGFNANCAALIPVTVVLALRLGTRPSSSSSRTAANLFTLQRSRRHSYGVSAKYFRAHLEEG